MVQEKMIEAYVLKGKKDASIEKVPMPPSPGPNEVLVKTLNVGICGSDIHYWAEGQCGTFVVQDPIILGHETTAVVTEVGSEVKHLKPGDRVVTEPAVPCERCNYCRTGVYNLCPKVTCHATPKEDGKPCHGTLTNYFLHNADYAFKIPDSISNEEAAMIEPLAVGVYSCKRARVTIGHKILVTGAGPIGIYTMMTAKAYGASKVVITDINEERLRLAKEVGADETILVTKDISEAQLVEKIRTAFGGVLPDISMECSAAPSCTRLVLLATKSGGLAIQIGLGPPEVTLPIMDACIREVQILGAFRYTDCFPIAIDLLESGKLNLQKFRKLITHRFDFKDCTKAYETAKSGVGMKVMIKVADN